MLKIEMLRSPHSFSANCYLISSDGEYAVVDPTAPYSEELVNGRVRYILLTHAHFDHILEIDSWVDGCGAEVIISEEGRDAPSDPMRNCFKLYNGSDRGYFGPVRGLADKESIPLPQKEFLVLFKLLSYQNKIFTRRQLMDEIWSFDSDSDERTVDVHIHRLRERFEQNPDFEIKTIRGLGYKAVKLV